MVRLRTVALAALVIVVFTDVTGDGESLTVSFGVPGREPIATFVVPFRAPLRYRDDA
jgi:hypothetical protein